MRRARLASPLLFLLLLAACASPSSDGDGRAARLEAELQGERAARDRQVAEARRDADAARDTATQLDREVVRLREDLAASRASTAAHERAAEAAMATVRTQEAELVRLRAGSPAPVTSVTGAASEAEAAMALLQQKNREIQVLQQALAEARNPGATGDAAPRPLDGRVRASNLDLELPVATVDGEPLSRRNFVEFLYRDLASPALLELLVNRLLVQREARRRGLEVSDVDAAVWVQEQVIDQVRQAGSPEAFEKRLVEGGYTRAAWEARLRYQARPALLVRRMVEQDRATAAGREAFEARVRARYSQVHSEKVTARHILVAVAEDAPEEEVAAARKKADAIVDALRRNYPFGDMARRQSDDPETKRLGGVLGSFDRSRFQPYPALNTAFFTLPPGTPSDPIRTRLGFHVVLVDERRPPDRPFDAETRAALAREVAAAPPSEEEQDALVRRLRAEAHVATSLVFDD